MDQEIFDWILLLVRWLHITVAVTWIGTSIFFMWLDRTFVFNPESKRPGHIGDLWMVHGGGFYHVEKLMMGPTKVPEHLHWFKWESYWTWMSGFMLICLVYYTGEGTMLLDSMVSDISYYQALGLSLFSIFGSWFFYDYIWETKATREHAMLGHVLTLGWLIGMTFLLCHTLSGRAAYIHIGGMMGTWMTANVFRRIIPRQLLMVEASKSGTPVNKEWAINAKNRSTHNTYFTLPVIFIMLSNHFPQTYGHEYNWLILLFITAGGAAIREYFVVRLKDPKRSYIAAAIGVALIIGVIISSRTPSEDSQAPVAANDDHAHEVKAPAPIETPKEVAVTGTGTAGIISGVAIFEGTPPQTKKLNLPAACAKNYKGDAYSNEILIKDGKLQNVLVRVVSGLEGKKFTDVPNEEVELDQRGCIYNPRVVGARVGQKVTFINSDPVFHNVRSVTTQNQKFNMAMPHQDQRETKIFNKPELFLQAKCSVHPWMGAYVAIMDHPFFSVTKADGTFEIKNLSPGKYTIEAWHEVFGKQGIVIEVTDKGVPPLTFTFKEIK